MGAAGEEAFEDVEEEGNPDDYEANELDGGEGFAIDEGAEEELEGGVDVLQDAHSG